MPLFHSFYSPLMILSLIEVVHSIYCPSFIPSNSPHICPPPARSPIYSHLSTSLLGLSTIRAFGKEETSNQYFRQYLNTHSQDWYLYLVTTRWFGMRIDLLTAVFLAIVAFTSIPLASSKCILIPYLAQVMCMWVHPSALNAGLVGLALTYTVSLSGTFQFCVRLSAEVENTVRSGFGQGPRVGDDCLALVPLVNMAADGVCRKAVPVQFYGTRGSTGVILS